MCLWKKKCQLCGNYFLTKHNLTLYCDDCAKKKKLYKYRSKKLMDKKVELSEAQC